MTPPRPSDARRRMLLGFGVFGLVVLVGWLTISTHLSAVWAQARGDRGDVRALLVVTRPNANQRASSNDHLDLATFRKVQLELVRSRLVLEAVAKELKDARGADTPVDWLRANIRASFVDDTDILEISVRGVPTPQP